MRALDANMSKTLWVQKTTKILGDTFSFGITVDPATGYLYVANDTHAWCLKVKK